MKAYIFPGQGAQFTGMGLDLYEGSSVAQELFEKANKILGFSITDIMFEGTAEELKQTKVTQPAIFLHSVILARVIGDDFMPEMVAGHSLGELSALVAADVLNLFLFFLSEVSLVPLGFKFGADFRLINFSRRFPGSVPYPPSLLDLSIHLP